MENRRKIGSLSMAAGKRLAASLQKRLDYDALCLALRDHHSLLENIAAGKLCL